jgi:multidrug efflux system membrane fusion protein
MKFNLRSALAIGVAAALAACSNVSGDDAPVAIGRSPVTVAAPVVRDVPVVRIYPGHVEAVERVELRPRISGYVESVDFKEGDFVRKGAILFRIDPRRYAAAAAEAEATLAKAKAEAALAERERQRAVRLLERLATSSEEAERRAAEAQVARASVAAAEAALASARLDLEQTRITAPISGRIGRAEVTAGNLVSDADRLAVLVSSESLYVRFDVDEKVFAGTSPTDWKARFTLPEAPASVYEGPLAFLDNEVASGTGTIRARVRIPSPDAALVPGRYGQVELVVGERRNALLVDEKALGADQGARYLLVVGLEDKLEYRPVSVGARIGPYRVIEQGLEPEERIVVTGLMRVRPGMPVEAREIAMADAAGESNTVEQRIARAGGES